MTVQRISKRTIDSIQANGREFTVWDDTVSGFGVRVRTTPPGARVLSLFFPKMQAKQRPHAPSRQAIRTNCQLCGERAPLEVDH